MRCPEIFSCQDPSLTLPAREVIAPKALCAKAPAMGGASLRASFSVGGSRRLTGGSSRGDFKRNTTDNLSPLSLLA